MNKKGFTLVELLAVIVILAIILAIAVPTISSIVKNSTKTAIESDAKLVLNAIKLKMLGNNSYDPTIINETNITTELNLSSSNYKNIKIKMQNGNPYVMIAGQNKWSGYSVAGTLGNLIVYNGLVAWLDASDFSNNPQTANWIDRSGNNNNGAPINFSYANNSGNDGSGGVAFLGDNDYVDLGANSASMNFDNGLTISTIVKTSQITGIFQGIASKSNTIWNGVSFSARIETNGNYSFVTSFTGNNGDIHDLHFPVPDTNYHSVVFTFNGTTKKIIVDGVVKTTANVSGKLFANNENIYVGIYTTNSKYYLKGNMKHIQIYNRALSDSEVINNYNIEKVNYGI